MTKVLKMLPETTGTIQQILQSDWFLEWEEFSLLPWVESIKSIVLCEQIGSQVSLFYVQNFLSLSRLMHRLQTIRNKSNE